MKLEDLEENIKTTDKSEKNKENLNYIKMWPLIYMYARCESNLVIVHVLPNMIYSDSFFISYIMCNNLVTDDETLHLI